MPLKIIRQDITKVSADAIVNSTNPELIGFSGADRAIHRVAGPGLDEYCRTIAPVKGDKPVITEGYNLPCRYIIHTFGPVWNGGEDHEDEQLEQCYASCLLTANELGCRTVALPLISAGAYGFSKRSALDIAIKAINDFLLDCDIGVYLCVFDTYSYQVSKELVSYVSSYIDDTYVREAEVEICSECMSEDFMNTLSGASLPRIRREKKLSPVKETDYAVSSKVHAVLSDSLEKAILDRDAPFSETLMSLIDQKGMTDVDCYKKAYVSRKTFSKIRCDRYYRPSKETVLAFALALELSLDETNALLRTAGFTLSHCFKYDIIIEYFIKKGIYDISEINETLYALDQPCFGCMA